jgi:hypothetical protein
MPTADIPYEPRQGSDQIDYECTVEHEKERWSNRIWITKVVGGHYKLFIRTEITNKSTGETSSEKTRYTLIHKRGFIQSKFLGLKRYKRKTVPNIEARIRRQVKKLAKKKKAMKSEEKLADELSQEVQNRLTNIEFDEIVGEARK